MLYKIKYNYGKEESENKLLKKQLKDIINISYICKYFNNSGVINTDIYSFLYILKRIYNINFIFQLLLYFYAIDLTSNIYK